MRPEILAGVGLATCLGCNLQLMQGRLLVKRSMIYYFVRNSNTNKR